MPLKWEPDKNPYAHNDFTILEAGPNTPPRVILSLSKRKKTQLSQSVVELDGKELSVHEVRKAPENLRDPRKHAEELLLVHAVPEQETSRVELEKIEELIGIARHELPPPLWHPLAIFCFMPHLELDTIELPTWRDLDLTEIGDSKDQQLDIVFDS